MAEELYRHGVRDIFTLCGGHIAPIYDGCLRYGIRLIDTRHEQAAAHAGDGYARLTRGVGVALVTAGPGVTDAVTGIANAFQPSHRSSYWVALPRFVPSVVVRCKRWSRCP